MRERARARASVAEWKIIKNTGMTVIKWNSYLILEVNALKYLSIGVLVWKWYLLIIKFGEVMFSGLSSISTLPTL